ncbi:bifunctional DnaQ family exonuclease/ATP-dependent helicase [Streptococcus oricebi]|uniref:3'-5' exonuclease DinG n=1 Tax=Streptococcus oricebi TaxID=1547447 RepID=A0ABS5B128_9STRE|nr:bifunctional DnaQ family exonuclease/ATP-dependent helicase [Streptococcus oricebi]MBP2622531.1 bifunctional DnaQ family exonuclease/ATP-dependent helicase [Streptococcus oricebi]
MKQGYSKYAVVDLEATGASNSSKIIQVGIVIIENGQIQQTYQTDINPHEPLDEHIKGLTGLSDARLSQAPDFQEVAAEIYDLIADAIFVAHNVKFDANLLAEALFWEGFELRTPRVDTVELAQIFFPTLEKYGLSNLCQCLDIDLTDAHTAIADALATAELFLQIQAKIKSLPKALVEVLLDLSQQLIYETHLAIQDVYQQMPAWDSKTYLERQGLFFRKPQARPRERKLSTDFQKNLALLGLDERKEQAIFARFVQEALEEEESSFLQAQAGLGKTYGYLLPLLARRQKKLVVTVPTKVLQDQIMESEGRKIEEVFGISFHNLKSPSSYIKLDLFKESLQHKQENRLIIRCKMKILVWLTETLTGDLDEIGQKHRYQPYLKTISHDGKISKKSLFYGEDFWQRGQEKASKSRVLITNHAYFLTRLEDDSNFIKGRLVVVDEAQKLFSALESFSRQSLSMTKILQGLQEELAEERPLLEKRLLESLQFELGHQLERFQREGLAELEPGAVAKIRQDLSELDLASLEPLKALFAQQFDQFWLESEQLENHRFLSLQAGRFALLDFQEFLPEDVKLFFVSATLSISRKVNLAKLLGFEHYRFYSLPYQTSKQQQIWIDETFPDVTKLSLHQYAKLLVQRIESLARLNRPLLVLFTSKDLLLAVSEGLSLAHLAQYRNGEAANIKRRFDRGESMILLGTGSFWEGTDFASQQQMIQIITRIPFDNPSDFFPQKMNKQLRLEGKNPFYDYSLPIAILRLKQALGRTLRNHQQQSAVLILDNRVYSKRYSKQIENALGKLAVLSRTDFPVIEGEMKDFFSPSKKRSKRSSKKS